jgi:hypothetical protein
MPDRHKIWAFCISCVGLRFCLCLGHLHYREFLLLVPACYIFLLCNHRRTESGTPDVKRGSMCASIGHQWCGGLYFTGAAVLTDGCQPLSYHGSCHLFTYEAKQCFVMTSHTRLIVVAAMSACDRNADKMGGSPQKSLPKKKGQCLLERARETIKSGTKVGSKNKR